jgi:5-methylcytosine-specific restriction endonuclease McrA
MFTVTKEWMMKHRTAKGGWNAAQMRQLNEFFPLKSGWMKRCVGKRITEDAKRIFEIGAQSKNAARKAARELRQSKSFQPRHETDFRTTKDFLSTYEWRRVRMQALKKYGAKCMCCGATPSDGAVMNVDHIKPRKLFPELSLDIDNLQILCHDCNHGKGNWDMTDWRPDREYEYEKENYCEILPNI